MGFCILTGSVKLQHSSNKGPAEVILETGQWLRTGLREGQKWTDFGGVAKDRTTIQLVQKETNTSNHGASGSKISYVSASDGRTL